MGGCSVLGCSNRTESKHQIRQGHLRFFRFPFPRNKAEIERRRKWLHNLEFSPSWKLRPDSLICEEHFHPKMFQSTVSYGTIKKYLRKDAVPHILCKLQPEHNYARKPGRNENLPPCCSNSDEEVEDSLPLRTPSAMDYLEVMSQVEVESSCYNCHELSEKLKKQEKINESLEKTINLMKKQLSSLKMESHALSKNLNKDILKNVCIQNPKNRHFSGEYIKNAYKLRHAAGKVGYKLMRDIIPLPSIRTLQGRIDLFIVNDQQKNVEKLGPFSSKLTDCRQPSKTELNILYYLGSYVVFKAENLDPHCESCLTSVKSSKNELNNENSTQIITVADFTKEDIVHCSLHVFKNIILPVEELIRDMAQSSSDYFKNRDIFNELMRASDLITSDYKEIPNCHSLKDSIVKRFIKLRLLILQKTFGKKKHKTNLKRRLPPRSKDPKDCKRKKLSNKTA